VKHRKNLLIVASILLASSAGSFAQVRLFFTTSRTYRQNSAEVAYRPEWIAPVGSVNPPAGTVVPLGTFGVDLLDGIIYVTGCPLNGSPTWFPPVPLIGCEIGATGYIVAGDLNNDGIRDDFSHWEVTSVVPTVVTEPSRPELCRLYAAPPSKLPRPIGAFINGTTILYYNTQTEAISEYNVAWYRFSDSYSTRTEMDQKIVPGRYEWAFPTLKNPERNYVIPVNYYAPPEGYKTQNNVRRGFRFTKLNDKPLVWTSDGYIAMDPRLVNHIEWEGNTAEYIFPAVDQLFFSIPDLGTPLALNPERSELVTTLFPAFVAPGTSRVLLPHPLQTGFYLPPGFVRLTNPPSEGVIDVELVRMVPTSSVAFDSSTRSYQMPCRFVNTYEGWAAVAFKAGTPAYMREPGANPDGDAYTNYIEWRNWVFGTALGAAAPNNLRPNPMVRDTIPPPVLTFVQARATRSTDSAGTAYWETSHRKTEAAYPPIKYEYEYSTDMVNWTVVGDDHPDWVVIETDTEIKARSKHETLAGNGYLRVKSTQEPEPPPSTLE
jgi:hypothetical protein